nr:MAG TPA: hypothetical protein [Caudoviricetes sp.]
MTNFKIEIYTRPVIYSKESRVQSSSCVKHRFLKLFKSGVKPSER